MENSSKALIIAASVLLSVMIISLAVYSARSFSKISKAEKERELTKEKAEFNQQFEIYDKKLMYGTDVLSCLNKAQSNNQKYVYDNYFGQDFAGPEAKKEILINVSVTLKTDVQERVKVYTRSNGAIIESASDVYRGVTPFSSRPLPGERFKLPKNIEWYRFYNGKVTAGHKSYVEALWQKNESNEFIINPNKWELHSGTIPTNLVGGGKVYQLLQEGEEEDNNTISVLAALLSAVTLQEQKIYNQSYGGGNDWYYASWKTASYDFKTKKFKCTGITYDPNTSYINAISFQEI